MKNFALFALALSACAHTPTGPAQVFENTFDYDLPQGVGYGRELRYQLRWAPGTQVRIAVKSTGRTIVRCNGCKGSKVSTSAIPGEVAKLEFVASAGGDRIFISSEDTQQHPTMSMSVTPSAEEIVSAPRSTEELEANRAKKEADKEARAAADKKAVEDRQAQRDALEAEKKAGAARCARKEAVSHVVNSSGAVIVNFCDASRATRVKSGEWFVAVSLNGSEYENFVTNEKATMEVAEHNCKVLNTPANCQRAATARGAFEAKTRQWVQKNRKPESWYRNLAMQTCAKPSESVPGSAACTAN